MNFAAFWLLFIIAAFVTLANHFDVNPKQSIALYLALQQPGGVALVPWLFQLFDILVLGLFVAVPQQHIRGTGMKLLIVYQVVHTLFVLLLCNLEIEILVTLAMVMCATRWIVSMLLLYMFFVPGGDDHLVALFVAGLQFVVLWNFFVVASLGTSIAINLHSENVLAIRAVGMFIIAVFPLLFFIVTIGGFQYIMHLIILWNLWIQLPEELTPWIWQFMAYIMAIDAIVLLFNFKRLWTIKVKVVSTQNWKDFFKYGGLGTFVEAQQQQSTYPSREPYIEKDSDNEDTQSVTSNSDHVIIPIEDNKQVPSTAANQKSRSQPYDNGKSKSLKSKTPYDQLSSRR